jgi:hypothetical protein
MPDQSLPADPHYLFDEAMRLATELDRAQLYTEAAVVAMGADAIRETMREGGPAHGTPSERAAISTDYPCSRAG